MSGIKLIIKQSYFKGILIFFLLCSYDFVEIYVGRRLVRRLSGGDDDDDYDDDKRHYDDDDKCDDDDDGIDDLDDIDEEEDGGVIIIQGTGEMIRIVFKSDYSVTRRGFFAKYHVVTPPPAAGK